MANEFEFAKFLDIKQFAENSLINDTSNSNGVLRLNRFVTILDIPHNLNGAGRKSGFGLGNNQEVYSKNGGEEFLAWNCFKVDCPAFKLEMETKEVDMKQRHYVKKWTYDDLSVSYLETSDMMIRHFFFEWMHGMLDTTTFQRRYYDDLKAAYFIIYPLNFQGASERYDMFTDLIPCELNSVNFDVSEDGNQTVLTTVKFKYLRHVIFTAE